MKIWHVICRILLYIHVRSRLIFRSMKLEFRHLNLVQTAVEEGGLTRAGQRLGISQSALSHQLRDIEDQLGVSLFHRVGRRLTLAPAGERILRAAKLVLPEIERAELDISSDSNQISGTIRIGVDDDGCFCWLPGALRRFGRKHANIELRLAGIGSSKGKPGDALQALQKNELDLALISRPARGQQVKFHEFFEEELVAILPAGHALAPKRFLQAKDFRDETVFYSGSFSESPLYERVLRPAGIRPKEVRGIGLTEAILELVKFGFGLAIVTRNAARLYVAAGEIQAIPVTSHGLVRNWRAAIRAGKKPPEHLITLIETLRDDLGLVVR